VRRPRSIDVVRDFYPARLYIAWRFAVTILPLVLKRDRSNSRNHTLQAPQAMIDYSEVVAATPAALWTGSTQRRKRAESDSFAEGDNLIVTFRPEPGT
jgi:hypothetical protein